MPLFGRERHPNEVPDDSPDLAYVMAFVTSVGGAAAYWTRRSTLGLLSGLGVGSAFALGGYWIQTANPEKHEFAHQICLISSVLFGGAMGYRAGSNPYVGPGGAMLAALGGVSSAYHLQKFLAWRSYEQSRILQAERMLREYAHKHPSDQAAAATLEATHSELGARQGRHMQAPSAAAAGAAHGRPHLDRRTPVPPGGF
ncbi:hypothetical protein ABPG77_005860 [Micractinium sp. CCAP 211/92]